MAGLIVSVRSLALVPTVAAIGLGIAQEVRAVRPLTGRLAAAQGPSPRFRAIRIRLYYNLLEDDLFDIDLLDQDDPFEITRQAPHLFKHDALGIDDAHDVWRSDPLFYPAKPPAHWLMVAQVSGTVLVVPLAPPDSGDPRKCRPIGCYVAAAHLAARYLEDR